MTLAILSLRLSRRAIAAVAVADQGFGFCDGRHLTSRKDRALPAATRYLTHILDLMKPTRVVVDAPAKDGSTTAAILGMVRALLGTRAIPLELRATADLLSAYGIPAVRSRAELRRVAETLWPELPPAIGRVKPFVLEAAALSLETDTAHALDSRPT